MGSQTLNRSNANYPCCGAAQSIDMPAGTEAVANPTWSVKPTSCMAATNSRYMAPMSARVPCCCRYLHCMFSSQSMLSEWKKCQNSTVDNENDENWPRYFALIRQSTLGSTHMLTLQELTQTPWGRPGRRLMPHSAPQTCSRRRGSSLRLIPAIRHDRDAA